MFHPDFRRRVEPLIPKFVLHWMDPFHAKLLENLTSVARAIPAGALVLDAGAGECPHAPLFAHTRYVKVDRGIGDERWDYSRVDALGDIHALPFGDGTFDAVVNIRYWNT